MATVLEEPCVEVHSKRGHYGSRTSAADLTRRKARQQENRDVNKRILCDTGALLQVEVVTTPRSRRACTTLWNILREDKDLKATIKARGARPPAKYFPPRQPRRMHLPPHIKKRRIPDLRPGDVTIIKANKDKCRKLASVSRYIKVSKVSQWLAHSPHWVSTEAQATYRRTQDRAVAIALQLKHFHQATRDVIECLQEAMPVAADAKAKPTGATARRDSSHLHVTWLPALGGAIFAVPDHLHFALRRELRTLGIDYGGLADSQPLWQCLAAGSSPGRIDGPLPPAHAQHRTWLNQRLQAVVSTRYAGALSASDQTMGFVDTGYDPAYLADLGATVEARSFVDAVQVPAGSTIDIDPYLHGTRVVRQVLGPNAIVECSKVFMAIGVSSDPKTQHKDLLTGTGMQRGIDWLAQQPEVRVINISAGYPSLPKETAKLIHLNIDAAIRLGVTFVAAIGNDGPGIGCFPARYDDVISVGAMTEAGAPWPGTGMGKGFPTQTAHNPEYITIGLVGNLHQQSYETATSFSTPIVAGICLIAHRYGDLDPGQLLAEVSQQHHLHGVPCRAIWWS